MIIKCADCPAEECIQKEIKAFQAVRVLSQFIFRKLGSEAYLDAIHAVGVKCGRDFADRLRNSNRSKK